MRQATIAEVVDFYSDLGFRVRVSREGVIGYSAGNGKGQWRMQRHIDQYIVTMHGNITFR